MSEELGEIAKWFRRLHFSLDAFVTEWRKSRGIPDSVIEEMETEMLKEAKSLWE